MFNPDEECLKEYFISEILGFDKVPSRLILSHNLSDIWRYSAVSKYDEYFMKGSETLEVITLNLLTYQHPIIFEGETY
jgi:hypothetical protein